MGSLVEADDQRLSVDALSYELLNRRFRNFLLDHARACLHAKLGEELDAQIRLLYVKEWDGITQSLDLAQAKGQERRPADSLDYLSVNHFYMLFEKYYNDLVPESAVPAGAMAKEMRKTLFTWLGVIKDYRNPIAHPPGEDQSIYDALALADAALRILRFLQLGAAEAGVKAIQASLLKRAAHMDASETTLSTVAATLPPRELVYDKFVGRSAELEELWAWYVDDMSHRWVLVGEGGKGKSSIAYQFAVAVQSANLNQTAAVLWISAKKRRFEESRILDITRPDFQDLDGALDRLLKEYGDSENIGKTTEAKRAVVLGLLSDFPSLIVVDDIDSVDAKDEEVVEFFTFDAPRTASKILLTSRRMYPGLARSSTRVTGLPEQDAREYFRVTAERLGLSGRTDLELSFGKIYEATEGSPLYMEDLLRLSRSLKTAEAIERWKAQKGDAARRYALQRECDLLSPVARSCLEAACWAKTPLSVAQLEAILGIGEDEAISAVQELESRFLVPGPEMVEGVPSYRAHRNLEVLVRQDLRADPTRLWLRNAVNSTLRVNVQDSNVADFARQVNVRVRARRLKEALEVSEKALQEKPLSPDLLALRAETLSRQIPPRMVDARQDWERARELGLTRREAFLRWAQAEERAGDWRRMFDAATAGLQASHTRDPWLCQCAGYAASRTGQLFVRGLDHETGQGWLDKAEVLLREALDGFLEIKASNYDLSRVYRALVVNAKSLRGRRGDDQIVYWTLRWLTDSHDSGDAVEEARRQAERYPQIKQRLEMREATSPVISEEAGNE